MSRHHTNNEELPIDVKQERRKEEPRPDSSVLQHTERLLPPPQYRRCQRTKDERQCDAPGNNFEEANNHNEAEVKRKRTPQNIGGNSREEARPCLFHERSLLLLKPRKCGGGPRPQTRPPTVTAYGLLSLRLREH